MTTVLIVEDDADLVEVIRFNLEREKLRVVAAADGEAGLEAASKGPDLIVLDLMLPRIDGLEVCRRLRKSRETRDLPILILSARAQEEDVVRGLELGADDYMTKPFSPKELCARIRALLRRSRRASGGSQKSGEILVDEARRRVEAGGRKIDLTTTEFNLLRHLFTRPGRVFTRNQLIEAARGPDVAIFDRTIDVHILALRRKLGRSGEWIETVRGVGYRFREEAE